jgi:RNA polymerase sigma factor (sigma-70 family)
MTSDGELLRCYAERRSEDAFAEVVRRYVDLAYSTALRQVNGDAHLAQDVTQSVFTDMARKSAELAKREVLSGWVYTSTIYAAAKAVRTEQRRQVRERKAQMDDDLRQNPEESLRWDEVAPHLDAAMQRLKDADREAVLLRFFENRSWREIGEKLGLNENAARMRIERALRNLQELLRRQGVVASGVALAAVISAKGVQAAPAQFGATVSASAHACNTAAPAGVFNLLGTGKAAVLGIVMASVVTCVVVYQFHQRGRLIVTDEGTDRGPVVQSLPMAGDVTAEREELRRLRGEVEAMQLARGELAARTERRNALKVALAEMRAKANSSERVAESEEKRVRTRYCMQLAMALLIYASDHSGEIPARFDEVSKIIEERIKGEDEEFGEAVKKMNLSPSHFEIVYSGSRDALTNYAEPGGILFVRERQPWRNSAGQWVKVYAHTDGSGTARAAENGNFDEWERKRIVSAQPGNL